VRDGVIPAALISSSTHYHRQAAGIVSANGVRIQVSGIDVIRDEQGAWRVLEDNVRVPSGVSYVISNRRVMAQTLPELFTSMRVRPVGDYPNRLRQALRASAPKASTTDRGRAHAGRLQLRLLRAHPARPAHGVELVEGRDLFCSGAASGCARRPAHARRRDLPPRRRRVLDPQQFRPDSCSALRASCSPRGSATSPSRTRWATASPTTSCVYTYVPDLIRYYLARSHPQERRHLAARGSRCARRSARPARRTRRQARRRLGWQGLVVGPDASRIELDELRGRLLADPRGWIAQPRGMLSTIPTLVEDGMRPRHADLRPSRERRLDRLGCCRADLTRVALPEGQLVVNSSQGGGSKDTWVLGGGLLTGPIGHRGDAADARLAGSSADQAAHPPAPPERPRRQAARAHRSPTGSTPRTRTHRSASSNSSNSSSRMPRHPLPTRGRSCHAEPHRRVAVLDRTLHRAQRRHARILDVHLQLLLEDPWIDEDTAVPRRCCSVMGSEADRDVALGRDDVISLLAVDRTHPASIAHSIASARENARRAREIVSTELWEALNQTNARMPRASPPTRRTSSSAGSATARALAIGSSTPSTSRDEAWHFFSLGRSIERADMTARLLATRIAHRGERPQLDDDPAQLRRLRGLPAHYRGVPSQPVGAEFLLLDRLFPGRSSRASSAPRSRCARSTPRRTRRRDRSSRAPARADPLRARVPPIADILDDLRATWSTCRAVTSSASEAIRQRYFPASVAPVWIGEVS
jgi:uncharacterized circularly permuted ATP-grasp superfamily protein/uncharacterized alpha-E superfamily protein